MALLHIGVLGTNVATTSWQHWSWYNIGPSRYWLPYFEFNWYVQMRVQRCRIRQPADLWLQWESHKTVWIYMHINQITNHTKTYTYLEISVYKIYKLKVFFLMKIGIWCIIMQALSKRCIPIVKGRLNINDMWRHMGQSVMCVCVCVCP